MFMEGPDAPRAGADLRVAREHLGWDLSYAADKLRIRASYLEALETGRLDQLPGQAYALGFLRSYATALGLDAEEMARRFRAEAGETRQPTELVFPVPIPERGLPAGALILLGLILAAGAYAGWYHLSGEGRLPAETVAPVPVRLGKLAEQALPGPDGRIPMPVQIQAPPAPPAPPRVEDSGQFEPRHAATEIPAPPPEPPPPPPVEAVQAMPTGGTPTTAIAMPVMRPMPQPDPPQAAPPQSGIASPDASDPANPDGARVVLRFTGDTWVQVKERGGQVLVTKVMKAGDVFAVPTRPNLILTTGNAGRVDVMVDGVLAPSLGAAGAVRKDVPLEPDQLKSGAAVPVSTRRQ
jgi:cytoskeleton protein RodZ